MCKMNRRDQILKRKGLSRRLLSVLLTLVMLLSMLPQVVFAAEPKAGTWKKIAFADITADDTIAITMTKDKTTWVLPNDGNAQKAASAITGTVSGDTLTTTSESQFGWKVIKSTDTFQLVSASDNTKYLYSIDSNNGIRQGKGENRDWKVDASSGYLYNVGLKRYVGVYNQQDWRSYTTLHNNIAGQTLNFWKLEPALSRPSGVISELSMLKDGDKVVIFNPSAKKALSVNSAGKEYYRAGVDVTLENTNNLTGYKSTELWTVGIKDGKYTFTSADGKKLSMGASYASIPLNDVNTEWNIESAATEGCFYIKNAVRGNYLEWYAEKDNFSTLASIGENETLCAMKLFLVTDAGGSDPDPEPEPTAVPISKALAGAKDEKFTVKGVVTFTDGSNVYLQDATGGICLYLSAADDNIKLGDTIVGTGTRGDYNGQPQLSKGTYVKSSGLTLAAKPTTIGAITNADICTYVKLTNVEITEIYDKNGSFAAPNVTVKDAEGKTIQIFKAAMKKVDGSYPFAVGDKVDVTAAVGYFNKLQLRTTVAGEITAHRDIFDPITDDMIPAGVKTVKEAGAITAKTENVTVIGQVVYHYGNAYNNKASINSIILEDVIDGEIYGFQVYDFKNYAKYKVGDIVKITGTVDPYGGVPQMKEPAMEVVKSGVEAIPAQEITVSQMALTTSASMFTSRT